MPSPLKSWTVTAEGVVRLLMGMSGANVPLTSPSAMLLGPVPVGKTPTFEKFKTTRFSRHSTWGLRRAGACFFERLRATEPCNQRSQGIVIMDVFSNSIGRGSVFLIEARG